MSAAGSNLARNADESTRLPFAQPLPLDVLKPDDLAEGAAFSPVPCSVRVVMTSPSTRVPCSPCSPPGSHRTSPRVQSETPRGQRRSSRDDPRPNEGRLSLIPGTCSGFSSLLVTFFNSSPVPAEHRLRDRGFTNSQCSFLFRGEKELVSLDSLYPRMARCPQEILTTWRGGFGDNGRDRGPFFL